MKIKFEKINSNSKYLIKNAYLCFQHGLDGSEKSPEKDGGTVEHEIESNQEEILENKKPPENEEESKHANKDLQRGTYSGFNSTCTL